MDRSGGAPSTSAPAKAANFGDRIVYPAANLRSDLSEEDVEKFTTRFRIIAGLYGIYHASLADKIHHNPEVDATLGGVATGISEAAFYCGFRVPLLPILKKLFDDMGIALGQLDPNGFTHINSFQARCLDVGIKPTTRLFWYHYDFKRNAKAKGFYTISRRVGRAKWAMTNSNNRGSHESWFYISGPRIARYSVWREVEPSSVIMPDLSPSEAAQYVVLNESEMGTVPLSLSRSEDWIFGLWGSGNLTNCCFKFLSLAINC